ncbi:Crp/Fnr family transcriptional regulator [Bacillus niameyensis]|uniref:Crp/Fnr family transcriptional regulator n=1 Tax=Bacillus niameyensis TaxID=1522308 RepID=UPI000780F487|nr:Crp/Fnr family transcriptional regulator [Bacillus niameyensis]
MNQPIHDFLNSFIHCEKELNKGAFLFQEGDVADHIFLVRTGKVRIGKITPDGREITFRICKEGELISEVSLFCEPSPYTVHAIVIDKSTLALIKKEELEEQLLLNPSLSIEFIKTMEIQRQRTQSKFRDLILHGKKGALYSTLIRLSNSYGVEQTDGILIDLPQTNQELANFCGMTREVVNRLLNELKKTGKLSLVEGKIVIHELQFLKNEIHCENCPVEICNIY